MTEYLRTKGQLGFEYLVIAGMILVLVLPFLAYTLGNTNTLVGIESATASLNSLAQATETAMNLGPGNAASIILSESIKEVEVEDGIFVANLVNGESITARTIANVDTSVVESNEAGVSNDNGLVKVFNAPVIIELTPESAKIGNTVTIKGDYFTPEATVSFSKRTIQSTFIDKNTMQFAVPNFAQSTNRVKVVLLRVASNAAVLEVSQVVPAGGGGFGG